MCRCAARTDSQNQQPIKHMHRRIEREELIYKAIANKDQNRSTSRAEPEQEIEFVADDSNTSSNNRLMVS
jgi:hypothetical protein